MVCNPPTDNEGKLYFKRFLLWADNLFYWFRVNSNKYISKKVCFPTENKIRTVSIFSTFFSTFLYLFLFIYSVSPFLWLSIYLWVCVSLCGWSIFEFAQHKFYNFTELSNVIELPWLLCVTFLNIFVADNSRQSKLLGRKNATSRPWQYFNASVATTILFMCQNYH